MFGRKRTTESAAQIRRMREALAWYADEANWRRKRLNDPGTPRQWSRSDVAADRGRRARTALKPSWSLALLTDWLRKPREMGWNTTPTVPLDLPVISGEPQLIPMFDAAIHERFIAEAMAPVSFSAAKHTPPDAGEPIKQD